MASPWPSSSAEQPSSVVPEDDYAVFASSSSLESDSWSSSDGLILLGKPDEVDQVFSMGLMADENLTLGLLNETDQAQSLTVLSPSTGDYYSSLVREDSPWGAWHLNETEGTTFYDYTSNHNNLTITGTLTGMAVAGPTIARKAASFPSSTGVYATGGTLSTAGLETWEAWVRLDAAPAGTLVLLSGAANATGTANVERGLRVGTDLKPRWAAYGGSPSGWTELIAPSAISTGVWHHIVGVLDGTNMILYVDGVSVASTAKNTGAWGGRPIRLHAGYGAGNAAAIISEAALYPSALTADRVALHYSSMTDIDPAIEYSVAIAPTTLASNIIMALSASNDIEETDDTGILVENNVSIIFQVSNEIFFTPDNTTANPNVPVLPFPTGSQTLDITAGEARWFRYEPVDDPGNFLVAFTNKAMSAEIYRVISEDETDVVLSGVLKSYPSSIWNMSPAYSGAVLFIKVESTETLINQQFVWDFVIPPYYDERLTPYTITADEYGQTNTLDLFGCTNETSYYPNTYGSAWLSWDYPTEVAATFKFEASQEIVVTTYVDGVAISSVQGVNPAIEVTTTGLVEFRVSTLTGMGTFKASWAITPEFIEPETFAKYLRVEIYESDGVTKITELPRRLSPQAQEVLNGIGSGSFQIHADDPIVRAYEPNLFNYRNVVKFFLGEKCIYAFRIRARESTWVSSSEYTGTLRTISGPTAIDILNDAHVVHDQTPSIVAPETRAYNWTSFNIRNNGTLRPWYRDEEWRQGFVQATLKNPPGGYKKDGAGNIIGQRPAKKRKKYGFPEDWPFPTARWVFCDGNPQKNALHGYPGLTRLSGPEYWRRPFYVAAPIYVRIAATADEWYAVYLDGEKILDQENYEIGYKSFTYADMPLSTGWHILGVQKITQGGYSTKGFGDGNDSFILGVGSAEDVFDGDGDDTDTVISNVLFVSSVVGWQCYIGPNVPGWTKAEVLESFVEEGVARNTIQSRILSTKDWTTTTDSYGVPWSRTFFDKEVSIGIKGTEFLQTLTEGNGFDVWLDPGSFILRAAAVRGTDKSASIRLEPRRNVTDWGTSATEDVINVFYVHYDGGWLTYEVPDSIAKYGRTEGFITLGDLDSPTKVIAVMDQLTSQLSKPDGEAGAVDAKFKALGQPSGSIIPVEGAVPFLDFEVGDKISAMNEYGNYNTYRVIALTITEDVNGQLSFDPELELVGTDVNDTILSPPTDEDDVTPPDPGEGSPEGLLFPVNTTPLEPPPIEDTPELIIDLPSVAQEYTFDSTNGLWWKIVFDTPGTYYVDAYLSTKMDGTTSGTPGFMASEPYTSMNAVDNSDIVLTGLDETISKFQVDVSAPTIFQFFAVGVDSVSTLGPCKIRVQYYQ